MRKPSASDIVDVCLCYRHDYGLLAPEEKLHVQIEALDWLRAWRKVIALDADEERIRREVIEECASMCSAWAAQHPEYSDTATVLDALADEFRALSDPRPESRSVVPDVKCDSRDTESH